MAPSGDKEPIGKQAQSLPPVRLLPLKYAAICLGALILNMAGQRIFLFLYRGPFFIYGALMIGSFLALMFKFNMDKRFIFRNVSRNAADTAVKFGKYSTLGVVSTICLWTFELIFHYLWDTQAAKYIGGTLGFSLGHYLKYQIDKHFVFNR